MAYQTCGGQYSPYPVKCVGEGGAGMSENAENIYL